MMGEPMEEVQRYKTLFTVCLNKTRVINDITTAMKTFRAERQNNSIQYRVLDRATNWERLLHAM